MKFFDDAGRVMAGIIETCVDLSFLGFGAAFGARPPTGFSFIISAHLLVTAAARAERAALFFPTAALPNNFVPNCCRLLPYFVSQTCPRFKLSRTN